MMLAWLMRGCVLGVGLVAVVWVGFWQTGQWACSDRLFLALVRVTSCLLLMEVLIMTGVPVLSSMRLSSHAVSVLQLVVAVPSRGSAAGAQRGGSMQSSQAGRPSVVHLSARQVPPSSSSSLPPLVPAVGTSVLGEPSLSASFVDRVLAAYHSPAAGTGQALYALSQQYGVDDAFALAFFWHESNFGVNGEAAVTHSLGNLRCIDGATCIDSDRGGYTSFPDWITGFAAWYALIAGPLYVGDGLATVQMIIPRYAPTADQNNEQAYIDNVVTVVMELRAGQVNLG